MFFFTNVVFFYYFCCNSTGMGYFFEVLAPAPNCHTTAHFALAFYRHILQQMQLISPCQKSCFFLFSLYLFSEKKMKKTMFFTFFMKSLKHYNFWPVRSTIFYTYFYTFNLQYTDVHYPPLPIYHFILHVFCCLSTYTKPSPSKYPS